MHMLLSDVLILQVGPPIVKAILKLWLKEDKKDAAADAAAYIMDLLMSRTSDKAALRAGHRQFEAIGDKIAQSFLPIFEIEGKSLDEGGRVAVALAVAEALNRAKIDAKLLAKRNLDPSELEKYLISVHPSATQHFSGAETALYRRIISESSQFIVDIASQLPSFNERTFAEVLKREDDIVKNVDEILEEVRRIRERSRQFEEDAAWFEEDYLKSVSRKLDKLELFGVDIQSRANRRHHLTVAYVTLSVVRRGGRQYVKVAEPERPLDSMLRSPRNRYGTQRKSLSGERQYGAPSVSVNQVLSQSRRLFVTGVAGSGKTTLLQWIAVRCARRDFPEELADWNNSIPFFVQLRQYVESTKLPSPQDFPRSVADQIVGTMPRTWAHDQLRSGRAVVLVDGVDELPEIRRQEVYDWLESLLESFYQARFIVTSRPHAVEEKWLAREGFDQAELQPMELAAIEEFVNRWHNAVREELGDSEEQDELNTLAANLKEVLRDNRPIRSLATNPLLCAVLCALHRDRRQQLPKDRIELYEHACLMLLERREKESGVHLRDYPDLNYRQKRALLQDLGYWMLANGWSEVERLQAETRLSRRLVNMEGISKDVTGGGVYRFFVERTGIVREPTAGQMGFTHRTFMEFLAAQAVLDEDDVDVLVQNAHNDQWREVIILAAGLASTKVRNELISAIIERGDNEQKYRQRLHLLAIACLETAIELAPRVRANVQQRMARLIPPKNMDEAQALASAGELAVPHLAARPQYSESIAAACVRALRLIAGESALAKLAGYVQDRRDAVEGELWFGWDAFNRKEYAQRVLNLVVARSPSLTWKYISTLDGFDYLTNLEELVIEDCGALKELGPLGSLIKLRELDLWNCTRLSDLSPLASLTHLIGLGLTDCTQVGDLRPLARLTKLRELYLSGFPRVSDLRPLARLTNLEKLTLDGFAQIGDLRPLAMLTNLTELSLRGGVRVRDISPLANLTRLTWLDPRDCRQIDDLSPLKGLTNLRIELDGVSVRARRSWLLRRGPIK
jgi:hypothetical protein